MNILFNPNPIHTDLPGLPKCLDSSDEIKHPDGHWYGFSHFNSKVGKLRVYHIKKQRRLHIFSSSGKELVSGVQIKVEVYRDDKVVLSVNFVPYGIDENKLEHSKYWCTPSINVEPDLQRQGIASAAYAHMRAFGYQVTPAIHVFEDARKMWEKFDPDIVFNIKEQIVTHRKNPTLPKLEDFEAEKQKVIDEFKRPDIYAIHLNELKGQSQFIKYTQELREFVDQSRCDYLKEIDGLIYSHSYDDLDNHQQCTLKYAVYNGLYFIPRWLLLFSRRYWKFFRYLKTIKPMITAFYSSYVDEREITELAYAKNYKYWMFRSHDEG